MDLYLNFVHRKRIFIYFSIFFFAFIFSSLDKFPFLYNVDDKIQTFQHSEISYKNFYYYKFISNNINKINSKCDDRSYLHCGQLFRIKSSTYLNYLYSSKILYLFDNIIIKNNNVSKLNFNNNGIDNEIINISKKYNYSIFFSYFFIFLISIYLVFKLDKYSNLYLILFIISIVLTNHNLFNFEISKFNNFFHVNPKAGTITDLQPKGILGFFILFSLIFFIKSSYKLLFTMLISMIFIHWAQAVFIHLYFILAVLLKEILGYNFGKQIKFKNIFIIILIFSFSFLLFNYFYTNEDLFKNLLLDFLKDFFSINFIISNYIRLIFYLTIFLLSIIFIKIIKRKNSKFSFYLINYLILGISALIFLEIFYYLNVFNSQNQENDLSLIYTRVIGNLYFVEFSFLISLILLLIFFISNLINEYIFKDKLNKIFLYSIAFLIVGFILETTIEINVRGGIETNIYNANKLFNKFNAKYFNEINNKIKYLPEEFFFTLCGRKYIKLEKKNIQDCKTDRNYKFLKKIINTNINNLNEEPEARWGLAPVGILDTLDPKFPYHYPIQLNLWYKKLNE